MHSASLCFWRRARGYAEPKPEAGIGKRLWFIKTKRRRVFDAGGPSFRHQRFAWRGLRPLWAPPEARGRGSTARIPGVNLPPILTAKEFGSELEIVRPRLCSGDTDHRVAAER
jgi:hypothetical protein